MKPILFYVEAIFATLFFILSIIAFVAVFSGAWWHIIAAVGGSLIGYNIVREIKKIQ